jgi:hypothetical protein
MATFSKGRKKKIKQKLPKKVWTNVQKDYTKEFPHSKFGEKVLKETLRKALEQIKSGVNDSTQGAEVQDETLLQERLDTDGAKECNVLRTRMGATHQVSFSSVEASVPGTPQVTTPTAVPKGKPLTKS